MFSEIEAIFLLFPSDIQQKYAKIVDKRGYSLIRSCHQTGNIKIDKECFDDQSDRLAGYSSIVKQSLCLSKYL